ncbi:uncharacterized protein LOC130430090 isoform X2 [Triplophysa dalaica]|nr:uncharacterized protein LOC130430090 isoform X2 [Triplophysa dalaica]XP_056615013.1 uncharacterized protein LOC130430090 isoform X2 [Triplophysa dalaica]
MEGDSVTLHTHLTHIQTQDQILWMYGPRDTRVADIRYMKLNTYGATGMKLDSQTGSLTITNIRIRNSGLYKLEIINSKETSGRKFNITVYERLPVPITTQTQHLYITDVCQTCSDATASNRSHVFAIIVAVVVVLMVFIMIVVEVKHYWTTRQSRHRCHEEGICINHLNYDMRAIRDEVSVPLAAATLHV